jgi:Asp/Glu/hydantoin racemase
MSILCGDLRASSSIPVIDGVEAAAHLGRALVDLRRAE